MLRFTFLACESIVKDIRDQLYTKFQNLPQAVIAKSETEYLIQQGLRKVLSKRTNFIIAHRLSTIRRADRILLIEQGRIEEQGNHQELMDLGGAYHTLYQKQFLHFQEQEVLGLMHTFE